MRNTVFPLQLGEGRDGNGWKTVSRGSKWLMALPGCTMLKVKPGFKWESTHLKRLFLLKAHHRELQRQWIAFRLQLRRLQTSQRWGLSSSICTACRTKTIFVGNSGLSWNTNTSNQEEAAHCHCYLRQAQCFVITEEKSDTENSWINPQLEVCILHHTVLKGIGELNTFLAYLLMKFCTIVLNINSFPRGLEIISF